MPEPTDLAAVLTALHEPLGHMIAQAASGVDLCAPYLSAWTAAQLREQAKGHDATWRLITDLNPRAAAYGSLSLEGLDNLIKTGVTVRSLPRVHAKVYLTETAGFLGSANLTQVGLAAKPVHNHEMTVRLSPAQHKEAAAQFGVWWEQASPVTAKDLRDCAKVAKDLPVILTPSLDDPVDLTTENALLAQGRDANVWIKGMYLTAAEADTVWNKETWIASPDSGRPRFEIGDLVVIYAKGAGVCNALVEVVGQSRHDAAFAQAQGISQEDAERWPWITDIELRHLVPAAQGMPLSVLGITGQSLQPGHRKMPVGGLATTLAYWSEHA